jgi:hypothetical protein
MEYEDLWLNLYEYVLTHYHRQNPIKRLMEEMDPRLTKEEDDWGEPGLRADQTLEVEVVEVDDLMHLGEPVAISQESINKLKKVAKIKDLSNTISFTDEEKDIGC